MLRFSHALIALVAGQIFKTPLMTKHVDRGGWIGDE